MSWHEDLAAWQREWLEVYRPDGPAPFGDITVIMDTGKIEYARVKDGAPPRPKLPSLRAESSTFLARASGNT